MFTKALASIKYFKLERAQDEQSDSSPRTTQPQGWRPFYLQRRVLAAFVLAFCGIIAALEALSYVSRAHHGVASSIESRHYLWTYGPTAILTLVAAFWARVAFQAQQHAPWQSMQQAVEAEKSILLDYISAFQPVAIWKALRNKHYLVAAGTTCSLLLSLAIVFSTGLFSLQEVSVPKSGVSILLHDSFSSQDPNFQSDGATAFDILYSVISQNGSYPGGTTADFAFQQFSAPNVSSDAIVIAPIQGIETQLGCESATLTVQKWDWNSTSGSSEDMVLEISTPSCRIGNFTFPAMASYVGNFAQDQCAGSTGSDGMRFVVAAAQISKGAETGDHKWDVAVDRSVALICKPTYSLLDLQAETNVSASSKIYFESITFTNKTLPDLTAWNITESMLDDWVAGGTSTEALFTEAFTAPNATKPFNTDMSVSYLIQIGAWLAGTTGSVDILFEDGMLDEMASSFYRAIAAQYVHKGLVQQKSSTVTGSAIDNEDRVMMTQLPLRVIEACLAAIIILALVMIVLAMPSSTILTPWNPNSISATAAIMASSHNLRANLSGTSASPLSRLQTLLKTKRFSAKRSPESFSVETSPPNDDDEGTRDAASTSSNERSSGSQWKPFSSLIFRVGLFAIVVAIIVALEIVLHVSETNDGLGYISTNEYMHYLWTVVPSLIMEIVGLGFASTSFDIRLLAPYTTLKSGAAFKDFMTLNFLDALDVAVIWTSTRTRHFAVLAITLATFLTSFLSIVTSGLFNAVEVPHNIRMNLAQQDTFTRLSGWNSTGNEASINDFTIAGYMIQENITSPQWTYETLAFPKLSIPASSQADLRNDSFVELSIPVLRPAPSCKLVTGSDVNYTMHQTNPLNNKTTYYMTIYAPTIRCAPWSIDEASTIDSPTEAPINDNDYFGISIESTCSKENASNPLAYYWGQLQNGSVTNIASMSCTGTAETVNAQTRFQLPSFNISTDRPPVPDESSAKLAEDAWVPSGLFASYFGPDVGPQNLDSFFQALVTGRWAIPKEYLGDATKTQEVANAIKFQDSIIKTQLYSRVDRSTINSSSSTLDDTSTSTSIPADVFISNRLRLYQDATSTRILDGLLASILLLGILASSILIKNRDRIIVPKSPSNIVAVASLLADSNFLGWYRSVGIDEDPNDTSLGEKAFAGGRFVLGRRTASPESGDSSTHSTGEKMEKDFTIYLDDSVDGKIEEETAQSDSLLVLETVNI